MSVARLRELRLVGFKSFAEKTIVEFGPGISAVVGPNGSGKSNLADALRWALGEQGRSLRTRKSEDVIFAGSAKRHGTGMADVSLLIDNSDRLLPLEYAEVELGRRLFRSGENEYLVNRQRVRLRDLVELLDAASLADNAFLFIGQGMVDQALSLRPEERRPLFEEVAGVRRHEKRRRQAETEIAEAEANLERVRDIIAELRPQARRLAAQAEQQAARESAGRELAVALVAAGRERWAAAAAAAADATTGLARAREASDAALTELRRAETELAAVTEAIAERAEGERARRARLDEVRSSSLDARLTETRARAELDALRRDRARSVEERDAAAARAETRRRELAIAPSPEDDTTERDRQERDERSELEEALATASTALRDARDAQAAESERATAARRALEARAAELERARRRVADLERRAREQAALADRDDRAAQEAAAKRDTTAERARATAAAEAERETALATARERHEAAEDRRREANGRIAALVARAQAIEGRIASVDAALDAGDRDRLVSAAKRRGGHRLLEGVEVERSLGRAVEIALGDRIRGVVVEQGTVAALVDERGVLVLAQGRGPGVGDGEPVAGTSGAGVRATEAARAAGGGALSDALRRDPDGIVGRLLTGVLWVPDLDAALAVRAALPFGWRVVTPAGQSVAEDGTVRLGSDDGLFERRADRERLAEEARTVEAEAVAARGELERLATAADEAARDLEVARRALDEARRIRRLAEEDERAGVRAAESTAREAAWQIAQAERLGAELERAREALGAVDPKGGLWAEAGVGSDAAADRRASDTPIAPLTQLETEVQRLRARRDALIVEASRRRAERDRALEERRRAELGAAMEEARVAELDTRIRGLVEAESRAGSALERVAAALAGSLAAEEAARVELERALAESGEARARHDALERANAIARERLRTAEQQNRAVEVAEMEARLGLENAREALLVELAGIGAPGLAALREVGSEGRALRTQASDPPVAAAAAAPAEERGDGVEPDATADELETALDAAIAAWSAAPAGAPSPPALPASRLAALRRRYHDLGATNPFAATESREVSERLTALEEQRADLDRAIAATRQLIEDLTALVATRFRDTFAALEGAFGRRFQQLFDGGEAQLTLTTPEDLSVTGIEITARPPGKKRQALAMLSGGERALTAVALLFAMLEVRPVPFCVLDEVDAALDEANVGRFGAALRGLAQDIQFVVITHNRATIEAADALYGVTVNDDAVSRVISLRLSDATHVDDGRSLGIFGGQSLSTAAPT